MECTDLSRLCCGQLVPWRCFPDSPSMTDSDSPNGAATISSPPSPSISATRGGAANGKELMSFCQSLLSLYGHLKYT